MELELVLGKMLMLKERVNHIDWRALAVGVVAIIGAGMMGFSYGNAACR